MQTSEQRANALVRRFVVQRYRLDEQGHLAECPGLYVVDGDGYNSTYGCDTGCEYVRFEATLACVHGERAEYEWGEFGDLASTLEEVEKDANRPAVLVDVDGTVALRSKNEGGRSPYDWNRVGEDAANEPICGLVEILRGQHAVVFVSGRDAECFDETRAWLDAHCGFQPGEALFMRNHKDNRPDHEVKLEIYRQCVEPMWQVAYVLDDRNAVVAMWRELGLTVLQVADGAF